MSDGFFGFCATLNTQPEPRSMGGMIEYGVSVSTKSSPRSVAIEKAQEELRWATDIRSPCIFLWMVEYGRCMT